MREQILTKLRQLKANSKSDEVWVVEFDGKRLSFASGKGSWKNIGAAKNALRNTMSMGNWRERLAELKKLEDEGIIKYVKL